MAQPQRALAAYRGLWRAQRAVFGADWDMRRKAAAKIRGMFDEKRSLADAAEIDAAIAFAEGAAVELRQTIVQAHNVPESTGRYRVDLAGRDVAGKTLAPLESARPAEGDIPVSRG